MLSTVHSMQYVCKSEVCVCGVKGGGGYAESSSRVGPHSGIDTVVFEHHTGCVSSWKQQAQSDSSLQCGAKCQSDSKHEVMTQ